MDSVVNFIDADEATGQSLKRVAYDNPLPVEVVSSDGSTVGDVTVSAVTPGTAATSLGKAEDAIHTSGDVGVMALGVRRDTAAAAAANGDYAAIGVDANGAAWSTLATLIAGENQALSRLQTMPAYTYSAVAAADVQVLSGAGVLHSMTFSCNDAAPTAGSIIVYDSLTETGTVVFNHTFTTTPFVPFTVVLDYIMTTGIYIGFTTTADVNVSCAFLAGAVA